MYTGLRLLMMDSISVALLWLRNKGYSSVNAGQSKILIYFQNTNHAILNSTFELVNASCSHFKVLTNCS